MPEQDDLSLDFLDGEESPGLNLPIPADEPKKDILGRPINSRIRISQSLIKAMRFDPATQDPQACPLRIKAVYLDGLRDTPSVAMLYGLYFEAKTLGRTRSGDVDIELPRTDKKGEKTATHIRLDEQIQLFKNEIVPAMQLIIADNNVQLEYVMPLDRDGYEFSLHPDLMSPILDPSLDPHTPLPYSCIDVKVTESIFSNYGDYAWGTPAVMDHTQAIAYGYALSQSDPDYSKWFQNTYPGEGIFPFHYLVIEHGTSKRYKWIRKRIMPNDIAEMRQTIKRTIATLESWKVYDFEPQPNYKDCNGCPLSGTCPKYRIGRSVEVI